MLHKPTKPSATRVTSKQTEDNSVIGILDYPLVRLRANTLISIKYEVERGVDTTLGGPCAADGEVGDNRVEFKPAVTGDRGRNYIIDLNKWLTSSFMSYIIQI